MTGNLNPSVALTFTVSLLWCERNAHLASEGFRFSNYFDKSKKRPTGVFLLLVEMTGIEPVSENL